MSNNIYFSGLNGIRAIASIAVVISHTTLALGTFGLDPFVFGKAKDGTPKGLLLAGYGVTMFFVLSGFLITYLLQVEKQKSEINIYKFYMRRILRIWPLYYLYMLIVFIWITMMQSGAPFSTWFFYLFYMANIPFMMGSSIGLLAHYWSLGTEEQFYLFWPWLNKKLSIKSFLYVCCIIFITLFSLKVAFHRFYPSHFIGQFIKVAPFHSMTLGGIGAILYMQHNKLFMKLFDNMITQFICWFIIFLVLINKFHIASIIDGDIISVVALGIIVGQINKKNRLLNLETNVFDFLGKISYGIYVIHPIIIAFAPMLMLKITNPSLLHYVAVYALILFATILFSYISHQYFEKIFMRFKIKYTVVESSPSKH